jgi:hypothetical protein
MRLQSFLQLESSRRDSDGHTVSQNIACASSLAEFICVYIYIDTRRWGYIARAQCSFDNIAKCMVWITSRVSRGTALGCFTNAQKPSITLIYLSYARMLVYLHEV